MAIKIPSKNIYEIQNPKIRDNVVDNVSVEYTTAKQVIENNQQVYNTDVSIIEINEIGDFVEQREEKDDFVGVANLSMRAVIGIKTGYNTFSFSFSKLQSNKYIKDVYVGKDSNGKPNINIQTIYKKYNGTATAETNVFWQNSGKWTYNYLDLIYGNDFDEAKGELPLEASLKEYFPNTTNPNFFIETSLSVPSESNITNEEILTISNDTYDIEELKCLTYVEIYKMTEFSGAPPQKPYKLNGTCEKYIATMLEISFMGNTIGIDLTDGSVTYGNGKKPFTLSGNELLQDSGKVKVADGSGNIVEKQLTEHLGNGVLSQYLKGKETATLLCDFNNYYDTDGNLRISTNCKNMFDTEQLKRHQRITVEDDGTLVGKVENDSRPINYANADIYLYLRKGTYSIQLEDITIASEYSVIRILSDKGSWLYDTSQNGFINGTFTIEKDTKIGIVIKLYNGDKVKAMLYRGAKHIMFEKFVPYQFPIGEKTIPYVRGSDGKDYPMSKNQDGSPKEFEVVGVEPSYDGAVWQKLFLLKT